MEFKTKTVKGGGKQPQWLQSFEIDVFSLADEIKFCIFDEDILKNDLVCDSTVQVKALCSSTLTKKVVPLMFNNERMGDLVLETKLSFNDPHAKKATKSNLLINASSTLH